jgi:hypothetical protein
MMDFKLKGKAKDNFLNQKKKVSTTSSCCKNPSKQNGHQSGPIRPEHGPDVGHKHGDGCKSPQVCGKVKLVHALTRKASKVTKLLYSDQDW